MVARTDISGLLGATLAVSASLPATYDAAGYAALTYTTVGEVESFGNHGATSVVTTHLPVATGVTAKVKGAIDYGKKSFVMGSIPVDGGQVILDAASKSRAHYSIKITYADTSVHYLDVLVSKFDRQDGATNDVMKVAVDCDVCRVPIIVPQV